MPGRKTRSTTGRVHGHDNEAKQIPDGNKEAGDGDRAEHEEGGWPLMGAAKMWLHHALTDVDTSLRRISCSGSGGLVCLDATHTSSEMMLFEYLLKVGATNLYFNNVCEPWKRTRDLSIKATLRTNGINVQSFKAVVLYEPWDARPDERPECMQIGFGSVGFFRRACSALEPPGEPLPSPSTTIVVSSQ